MTDVFVSYKAEDRRRVKPLVEALQGGGFSVWWDEQIGGGAAWRHAIETELNAAKCVIVVWSNRSVGPEGTFVQDEATRAQQRRVYVPVLIDKVHLPLGFGETQALPLTGWHGNTSDPRYQAVLAAVRRNVGKKGRAAVRLPAQPHVDRRAMIAGGAVATAAIAGVGAWALLKPSSAGAASDSIAVLPFENLSGDPNQAYFSDGIAEEIRSALARIAGLKVVGRTSSEAVRKDDAETAAKKLAVANILSGSVRQSPSTIRVTAELVDGRSGLDRWSQDYDRSPGDSIKIQTDIAENVATALSAALGAAARSAIAIGGTANAEAQRLFIQAEAIAKGATTQEEFERALQLLDRAIMLDPQYADAFARKAGLLVTYGNSYATAEQLPKNRAEALRLAKTALAIAPNLPSVHLALSQLYASGLQIGPAYAQLERARQLAPGDANVLVEVATFKSTLGDTDAALSFADQAIKLDPLNVDSYAAHLTALFHARRYQDAVNYGRSIQAKFAQKKLGSMVIADCLVLLGRNQEAEASYSSALPGFWRRLTGEAIMHIRAGDRPAGQQKLEELRKEFGDAASTQIGEIYAQFGDKDKAFAALDRGFAIKDAGVATLRVDPFLDPLRSDPRFAALLQKMNFPAA
jgi:serine/threonine-protein kinase